MANYNRLRRFNQQHFNVSCSMLLWSLQAAPKTKNSFLILYLQISLLNGLCTKSWNVNSNVSTLRKHED